MSTPFLILNDQYAIRSSALQWMLCMRRGDEWHAKRYYPDGYALIAYAKRHGVANESELETFAATLKTLKWARETLGTHASELPQSPQVFAEAEHCIEIGDSTRIESDGRQFTVLHPKAPNGEIKSWRPAHYHATIADACATWCLRTFRQTSQGAANSEDEIQALTRAAFHGLLALRRNIRDEDVSARPPDPFTGPKREKLGSI